MVGFWMAGVVAWRGLYLAVKRVGTQQPSFELGSRRGGTAQAQGRAYVPKEQRACPGRKGFRGQAAVLSTGRVRPAAMSGFHGVAVVMTTYSCRNRAAAIATRAWLGLRRFASRLVRCR